MTDWLRQPQRRASPLQRRGSSSRPLTGAVPRHSRVASSSKPVAGNVILEKGNDTAKDYRLGGKAPPFPPMSKQCAGVGTPHDSTHAISRVFLTLSVVATRKPSPIGPGHRFNGLPMQEPEKPYPCTSYKSQLLFSSSSEAGTAGTSMTRRSTSDRSFRDWINSK
jgi:hypothetical protein